MKSTHIERLADPRTRLRFTTFGRHRVPDDWRLANGGLQEHLVWLITAGHCRGCVAGNRAELGPFSLMWLPPRTPFEFALVSPARPIALYRFRFLADLPKMDPIVIPSAPPAEPVMAAVHDELSTRRALRGPRLRALVVTLAIEVARRRGRSEPRPTLSPAQVEALQTHVRDAGPRRLDPADLARLLRLSPDYFTRVFRQTFGVPPRKWLVRQRINEAAFRLADPRRTISEVASDLGYEDVFLFSRQFKSVMGVSPRSYRSRA